MLSHKFASLLLLGASAVMLVACAKKESANRPSHGGTPPPSTVHQKAPARPTLPPEVAEVKLDESAPDDPARKPTAPKTPPERVAVRYVLVSFEGAKGSKVTTRSEAVARQRAARIVKAARKKGAVFETLAHEYSDVPQEERGKQLVFRAGHMAPAFEAAAFGMGVGQVSDAVKTEFGYYVILRDQPEEYSTAHVLVQYKGARGAAPGITRTKEEARARAEMAHEQATDKGVNFAVVAERYSDSPSRIRGGVIQPIVPGRMPPEYANYVEAVRALKVGEVSPVVETPFGFHVIKRLKMERIRASHILIAWTGAAVAPRQRRTQAQAETLVRQVWRKATAKDADFAALAKTFSDDTTTADKGGDLGWFARGTKVAKLEQIAFALKKGQVSDVVQTRFGYHVILRTE